MNFCFLETPLGFLKAVASPNGICRLQWSASAEPDSAESNAHLQLLRSELEAYFRGELREFSVALELQGTDFQKRVWNQLRHIPYGQTISYQELACRIDSPNASRAVGAANGANAITIVIPCHRVIAKSGVLQGYAGTLWRKQRLLDLESQQKSLW